MTCQFNYTLDVHNYADYLDRGIEIGFLGFSLKERKANIYNDGNDTWSTSTMATIGLAVKNAMLIPEKTANKYVYIDSFTVSQNQVLASFEKATGTDWVVAHVNAEEQLKTGLEKMSKGDFTGAMSVVQYINFVTGHGGNFIEYQESANELLSLPQQTLDEVVAGIVKS